MTRSTILAAIIFGLLPLRSPMAADGPVDYVRDVKPLLIRKCAMCHGAMEQNAGLRLDAVQLIRKGGDTGSVMTPGKADESVLIEVLTGANDRLQMPLDGEPLTPAEIDRIRAWINQGAKAADESFVLDPADHWSFHRPQRPDLPQPATETATIAPRDSANPIDAFLAARQRELGLVPAAEAPRSVLLRRVSLDLVGLPPTPDELQSFLSDPSPDAYEKVVERLLASPHYGERWGRHWMDVWRYSDWSGFNSELRNSARHIWRWRDWIVESLNKDVSYDRMIVEMLAGDELVPDDPEVLRATGFLARNYYKFNRNVWLDDCVEHTAKAFLGLTLNCARCHDHRFDPIPQTAYYELRAFFEPHRVRTDPVSGVPDVMQDGLPRVYDADLDASTFLFARGNELEPDTGSPMSPALPSMLGHAALAIQPIELQPEMYYPGLKPHVQQELIEAASRGVSAARDNLLKAEAALQKTQQPIELAEATHTGTDVSVTTTPEGIGPEKATTEDRIARMEVDAAAAAMAASQARLTSLRAAIAADRAAYAVPPAPDAKELALIASGVQRAEQLLKAESEAVAAELRVLRAEQKAQADQNLNRAVIKARNQLATLNKKLEAVRRTAGEDSGEYTPLTEVYPKTSTGRRLALARWIASDQNPLTARVAVNHIWLRHFGTALVPTVFDFGNAGQPPTHPELLDWLAVELMSSGWSLKHLHRLIVTSDAYRRDSAGSSAADQSNAVIDPDNVSYWRMNSRRLEAEIVRDSVLCVAGRLDLTVGGPDLDQERGFVEPRRSIYFRTANEKQMQFLMLFDGASVGECYRRSESIVPQQALALANSTLALENARLLAKQIHADLEPEPGNASRAFVRAAFERVLSRQPVDEELDVCCEFLGTQARLFSSNSVLTPFESGPASQVKPADDPHQRARENLIHLLMNHNDFVTIP